MLFAFSLCCLVAHLEWPVRNIVASIQGGPKMAPFLYSLTSSNINRFSKLLHYQNYEKICNNTITKDPTTPKVCRYITLWNVKCLESNNWKQNGFCNNTFFKEINNREQRVYCLSYCLKLLTCCSFYIKCSICSPCCGTTHSTRGDTTDQWRDRWNASTVCPTQWRLPASAGWLSWIVDVDRHQLLKGTPNSAIDWIPVRAVWGHMWGSMNVTFTWQVQCTSVCSWQCVTTRRAAANIRARCQRCRMWQLL